MQWIQRFLISIKVEKILKGSLNSIPSPFPSGKIQIMGGKVCLRCKGKTLLDVVNKLLKTKRLLTSPSNVYSYYLNNNFPTNNLNFHGRWWDWLQAIFLNLFYFSSRMHLYFFSYNYKDELAGHDFITTHLCALGCWCCRAPSSLLVSAPRPRATLKPILLPLLVPGWNLE